MVRGCVEGTSNAKHRKEKKRKEEKQAVGESPSVIFSESPY